MSAPLSVAPVVSARCCCPARALIETRSVRNVPRDSGLAHHAVAWARVVPRAIIMIIIICVGIVLSDRNAGAPAGPRRIADCGRAGLGACGQ